MTNNEMQRWPTWKFTNVCSSSPCASDAGFLTVGDMRHACGAQKCMQELTHAHKKNKNKQMTNDPVE